MQQEFEKKQPRNSKMLRCIESCHVIFYVSSSFIITKLQVATIDFNLWRILYLTTKS